MTPTRLLPFFVLLILMLATRPAPADEAAYTCDTRSSGAAQLVAQEEYGACVGFEVRVDGKRRSRGQLGFRGSGVLLTTADGRSVVFVQTFPYVSTVDTLKPLPGVVVFRDGRKVASHSIGDLLVRPDLVAWSTSHATWVSGPEGGHEARLERPTSTWTLYTSSFRRIEVDTTTGAIVRADDTDIWKACERIVAGQAKRKGQTLHIERPRALKGDVPPSPLVLTALADVDPDSTVFCVSGSNEAPRLVRTIGHLWPLGNGIGRRP